MNRLLHVFILFLGAAGAVSADHLVILGFDGLSSDGIRKVPTPVLHDLMRRGAYSLHACGVIPTVRSPNWASMIMGAGPAEHGVTSNDWKPDKFDIAPICIGDGGIFPTIFGLTRKQHPNAVMGVFHDWEDFARLLEGKSVGVLKHGNGPDETMDMAIAFVKQRKPSLTFVHCDHVDSGGHKFGDDTSEYYQAVAKADALVGRMLAALNDAVIANRTIVPITSDHGGVGKKHGGATMAE